MTRARARLLPGLLAAAALAIALAGCGSGGSAHASRGSDTATASAGGGNGSASASATVRSTPGCTRLARAGKAASKDIEAGLASFTGVHSLGSLAGHVGMLERTVRAAQQRIAAVPVPPGPLARDQSRMVGGLHSVLAQVNRGKRAAAEGQIGAATRDFSRLSGLAELQRATRDAAGRCVGG